MKVATLNINSINARLQNLLVWLNKNQPDVMLLQEIKTDFNGFPFFELQMSGYHAEILGQKSYNGVAVLSREPICATIQNLPRFDDLNSRYLEAKIIYKNQEYVVSSIYLPNGTASYNKPDGEEKLAYKLRWMDAFLQHAEELLLWNKNVILGGDFNVILKDNDVYNPELFKGGALYCPKVCQRLSYLQSLGYKDAFRLLYPLATGYTYWDYMQNAFINDLGLRIDYLFCSPYLADRLFECAIDKDFRALEKASDHTILTAQFED